MPARLSASWNDAGLDGAVAELAEHGVGQVAV